MSNAIRSSTNNKYETYQQKFADFCIINSINMAKVNTVDILNFLSILFESGNSFSVIKSAKAAVNQIVSIPP